MANNNIVIAKLDLDTKELIKSAGDSAKQIQALRDEQQKLTSVGKETSIQFVANAAALDKLETAYKAQQAAVSAQISEDGKLLTVKKAIKDAVNEVNKSENDYLNNNKELLALKKNLNTTDDDYEKRLDKINSKLQENNRWLNENGSANARLVTTMNDYKQQVSDSFDSINIFNGGLSGFISRAEEAGGTGPLLKGAFEGMATGIMGMTRSALAFIATPFGMVLAAVALVIALVQNSMDRGTESAGKITKIFTAFSVITDKLLGLLEPLGDFLIDGIAAGFEMAGKAADAAMGFIADGLSFLGFDDAAQGVKDFTEDVKNTAAETTNLKNAQKDLAAQMALQEVANEKAKQDAQEFIKISEDQTKSEKERLKALQEAANIETKNFNERKQQADEGYNQAVRQAALGKGLTADEIANLQKTGAAYAEKLMRVKGFTQEEIDALKDAQLKKMKLNGEETKMVEDHAAARQKVADDAKAKREAEQNAREDAETKRKQKAQKALDDEVQRQSLELKLFIANQGTKAKSLEEELDLAKQVADKKKAIADAELKASGNTAMAKKQHELAYAEIRNDLVKTQADVAIANADRELKTIVENNKRKIAEGTFMSEELYKSEQQRLTNIEEAEKAYQKRRYDERLINEQEYQDAIKSIDEKSNADREALNVERRDAEKSADATNLAAKRALDTVNHDYDLQYQLKAFDDTYEQEKAAAIASGMDMDLFEEGRAERRKKIEQSVMDNKLSLANSTFGNLATILGKESKAGKAMAVAQATIDTYKSAVSAYSAMVGIPIVGPALAPIAAGAAVAAGIANVKKITATKDPKTPKAEKGALFNIGGNRHSAGGTLFTGADGTRFEAEQGELIGVMNRNAAAHFMAFNNAFPTGGSSAPNYFANGGIVSREMAQPGLNIDELAAKISIANAAMPAPVVAVQDIISQGNSYVRVRDAANF
jgi:hypothetical protein